MVVDQPCGTIEAEVEVPSSPAEPFETASKFGLLADPSEPQALSRRSHSFPSIHTFLNLMSGGRAALCHVSG